jgi:hypothetical protein
VPKLFEELFLLSMSAGISVMLPLVYLIFQAVTSAAGGFYIPQNVPATSCDFLDVMMMCSVF